MPRAPAPAPRKNARIDAFVLDALGFDGPRSNPRRRPPRDPRPSAPYHPSADPWAVQRALIAEHQMHAAAARQQAYYDPEALEVAEYHDAEAERLEAELDAAGRGVRGRRRRNPRDAHDPGDWVTIEECACHSCAPARLNPRAPKRKATGAYADLDSIVPVIAEALAKHGLTMDGFEGGVEGVKFTRGGKSRAGACSYSPSLHKCKIMFNGLAWPAFTEEQRLNTILHEAAHAIQFLTTGRSDHGPVWQRIAKSIGCTGDRCMSVEASQAMVDAYAEAKGLPKRKVITPELAREASVDFAVGDYVSFDHKRARWSGKIVSKGPMHATVAIQSPRQGITGKIPYPSLQKEAPPRFAEKVAGVDKPAPGESLSAWQARTGRGVRANPTVAEQRRAAHLAKKPPSVKGFPYRYAYSIAEWLKELKQEGATLRSINGKTYILLEDNLCPIGKIETEYFQSLPEPQQESTSETWVVRLAGDDEAYWSDSIGDWVRLSDADRFSSSEKDKYPLPEDGEWVRGVRQ